MSARMDDMSTVFYDRDTDSIVFVELNRGDGRKTYVRFDDKNEMAEPLTFDDAPDVVADVVRMFEGVEAYP